MLKKIHASAILLLVCQCASAQGRASLSEQDFLGDVPIVLSVSRLAQRLDETPGALTILDRDFIRKSGARDVADLLRLVPGFQSTTSFETDAPMVSYHGRNDDYSNRLQVLVDGRPVYSSYLFGSIGMGLQTLAMDDIERIEVLRGSNSAAYGARAFLGVVNIVSRDVRDTAGHRASVQGGQNGIGDASVSVGWGQPDAMYRLSVDRRADDGLAGAFGRSRIHRVNFSSHFNGVGSGELDFRAGATDVDAGRGSTDPTEYGNAARMRYIGARFAQVNWNTSLDADTDITLTASHTEMANRDRFPYLNPSPFYAPYYGISINFSADEYTDILGLQWTRRLSPTLRLVSGMEYQSELNVSPSGFDAREKVGVNFSRLFGNAEWVVHPSVILNAGAMFEHNNISGDSVSPRLMVNWHASDNQVVRAGVSTAFRPPSAYEKFALVRYYDIHGENPTPPFVQASGRVGSEKVLAQELGYHFHRPHFTADARLFREQITDGVWCNPETPTDCINKDDYTTDGLEYQVTWRPTAATQVFWSQTWGNSYGLDYKLTNLPLDKHWFRVIHAMPEFASAVSVMHTLASGLNLSVMYSRSKGGALMSNPETGDLNSASRLDLRLAKELRWGRHKAELALTVQNLGSPYKDGSSSFGFEQRAMASLRLED